MSFRLKGHSISNRTSIGEANCIKISTLEDSSKVKVIYSLVQQTVGGAHQL